MSKRVMSMVGCVWLVMAGSVNAGVVIDDFEVAAFAPIVDTSPDMIGEDLIQPGLPSTNVIGGERESVIFLLDGTSADVQLDLAGGGDHGAEITVAPGSGAFGLFIYDGPNFDGLGDFDITANGQDSLDITFGPGTTGGFVTVEIQTNIGTGYWFLDPTGGGTQTLAFEDFDFGGEGEPPPDYTQVYAIIVQWQLDNVGGSTPATIQLDHVSTSDQFIDSMLGDMNCDGVVNGLDIQGFVNAVMDPLGACDLGNGDFNGDVVVDIDDADAFLACVMAGGGC